MVSRAGFLIEKMGLKLEKKLTDKIMKNVSKGFVKLDSASKKTKEYDKAKEYLEKALEINPDNPYALLNMGVVYEMKGNKDKAIKMYEKLIAINPDVRAGVSTDPEKKGDKLVDIAKSNLEKLLEKD